MYATQADMVLRFGEREVIALTDRDNLGEINQVVLDQALVDASAEADAYLAGRYPVPLANPPRFLVGVVCDVARYRLCGGETQTTEEINDRYRNAVKLLESVSAGKLQLGASPGGAEVATDNTVTVVSGGRVFARDRSF